MAICGKHGTVLIGAILITGLIIGTSVIYSKIGQSNKFKTFELERYKLLSPKNANDNINLNLHLGPPAEPSYGLEAIFYTLEITAQDVSGNKIYELTKPFDVIINFKGYDLASYKKDTIAIYSSKDAINWSKLKTEIDFNKEVATSRSKSLGIFALIGERLDIKISPYYKGGNRIEYNFEEILGKDFLEYKNEVIRFTVEYPIEAKIYEYSGSEIKDKFGDQASSAIAFSLVSQLAEGTELYDGVLFEISSYRRSSGVTLEEFAKSDTSNDDETINLEKNKVDNELGVKYSYGTYGGGEIYYVLTPSKQYLLKIHISPVGRDKDKFAQVARKMLSSFYFIR